MAAGVTVFRIDAEVGGSNQAFAQIIASQIKIGKTAQDATKTQNEYGASLERTIARVARYTIASYGLRTAMNLAIAPIERFLEQSRTAADIIRAQRGGLKDLTQQAKGPADIARWIEQAKDISVKSGLELPRVHTAMFRALSAGLDEKHFALIPEIFKIEENVEDVIESLGKYRLISPKWLGGDPRRQLNAFLAASRYGTPTLAGTALQNIDPAVLGQRLGWTNDEIVSMYATATMGAVDKEQAKTQMSQLLFQISKGNRKYGTAREAIEFLKSKGTNAARYLSKSGDTEGRKEAILGIENVGGKLDLYDKILRDVLVAGRETDMSIDLLTQKGRIAGGVQELENTRREATAKRRKEAGFAEEGFKEIDVSTIRETYEEYLKKAGQSKRGRWSALEYFDLRRSFGAEPETLLKLASESLRGLEGFQPKYRAPSVEEFRRRMEDKAISQTRTGRSRSPEATDLLNSLAAELGGLAVGTGRLGGAANLSLGGGRVTEYMDIQRTMLRNSDRMREIWERGRAIANPNAHVE